MGYEPVEVVIDRHTFENLGDVFQVQRNPPRKRKHEILMPGESYAALEVKLGLFRPAGYDPNTAPKISNGEDVYEIMESFSTEAVESMAVLLLTAAHTVIGVYIAARGTSNQVSLTPADLLRPALVANADRIIMVHNHPSGKPDFSMADKSLTARVKQACEAVGIRLLDHVVIGAAGAWASAGTQDWF